VELHVKGVKTVMHKRKSLSSRAQNVLRAKLIKQRMHGSFRGIADVIKPDRGESLMEVIVSILIFTILLTTAVAIIRSSLVITGNMIADATAAQHSVNEFILDDAGLSESGEINFSFYDSGGTAFFSSHTVDFAHENGILVFRPQDGGGP